MQFIVFYVVVWRNDILCNIFYQRYSENLIFHLEIFMFRISFSGMKCLGSCCKIFLQIVFSKVVFIFNFYAVERGT